VICRNDQQATIFANEFAALAIEQSSFERFWTLEAGLNQFVVLLIGE